MQAKDKLEREKEWVAKHEQDALVKHDLKHQRQEKERKDGLKHAQTVQKLQMTGHQLKLVEANE